MPERKTSIDVVCGFLSLAWESIHVPCLDFCLPAHPALLSLTPEPSQEPGMSAIQDLLNYYLFNKPHSALSMYIAKVSTPGYSLHGNGSRSCSWKHPLNSPASQHILMCSKGRNGREVSFSETPNVVCKARNVMCQLFNFHCYLPKWSFEWRENVPSASPCDNAWFYSQAHQPLTWHFN